MRQLFYIARYFLSMILNVNMGILVKVQLGHDTMPSAGMILTGMNHFSTSIFVLKD